MVKSIGFDPVPESKGKYAVRFVCLSWKDAILRTFDMRGRPSRAAFFVSIVPVIFIWIGILTLGILLPKKYNTFDNILFMIFLILPVVTGATLVFRRMHNIGSKAISENPLGLFIPYVGMFWVFKIFKRGDVEENIYGDPHVVIRRPTGSNV